MNLTIDINDIRGDGEHVCLLHLCPYYIEDSANAT